MNLDLEILIASNSSIENDDKESVNEVKKLSRKADKSKWLRNEYQRKRELGKCENFSEQLVTKLMIQIITNNFSLFLGLEYIG